MNEIAAADPRGGSAQPAPYTDRRSLSEAWYRALFDPKSAGGTVAQRSQAAWPEADSAAMPMQGRAVSVPPLREPGHSNVSKPVRVRLLRAAFTVDARTRTACARDAATLRAAWRDAAWRRTSCRATLPGGRAVDLLVQQRGDMLRLVAIYDGRDAARVSRALLHARGALLQRGVRVEVDARQKGTS